MQFLFCFSQEVNFRPYREREKVLVQGISLSPDGRKLYFSLFEQRMRKAAGDSSSNIPELAMYEADKKDTSWDDPVLLPFSGKYLDYEPTVSPDGKLIFYNSKRPVGKDGKSFEKNNIWFVEKNKDSWSEPKFLGGINTKEFGEDYPTITMNRRLYFVKEMPTPNDTINRWKIYSVKFNGEKTTSPVQVFSTNNNFNEGDPWVSPDESYLIFTRWKVDSAWEKTCDLYISIREKNRWTDPVPLKELNSRTGPDYSVTVSPDEEYIYYRTSNRYIRLPFIVFSIYLNYSFYD